MGVVPEIFEELHLSSELSVTRQKTNAELGTMDTFAGDACRDYKSFWGINFSNEQPKAFLMRIVVLRRTSISPASIR